MSIVHSMYMYHSHHVLTMYMYSNNVLTAFSCWYMIIHFNNYWESFLLLIVDVTSNGSLTLPMVSQVVLVSTQLSGSPLWTQESTRENITVSEQCGRGFIIMSFFFFVGCLSQSKFSWTNSFLISMYLIVSFHFFPLEH